MRSLKSLGLVGALLASALVGGTVMSVVLAHPAAPAVSDATPDAVDADAGAYCQTFLDEFAKQLGVDESALLPAAKAAANAAIDKAVADGTLSKDFADKIKERIANANGNACAVLGAKWRGLIEKGVQSGIGQDLFQAAANALHLSTPDLKSKLKDGQSLKQIAQDQKVDYAAVTTAVHNAAKADLDKLVAAGKLTQEQENQILDRLDQALKDGKLANGHFGFHGFGGIRGLGPKTPSAPQASPSGSSS
jgi:uncharacterized protein YidB (DUF937 family)